MGRSNGAISEVYEELKEQKKEGFETTKAMVQNRTRRESEILAITDHDTEVARSFKYLETVSIILTMKQNKSKLKF
jgi:hypothetical protein